MSDQFFGQNPKLQNEELAGIYKFPENEYTEKRFKAKRRNIFMKLYNKVSGYLEYNTQLKHFEILQEKGQYLDNWKYLSLVFAMSYNADAVYLFDNDYFLENRKYKDEDCCNFILDTIKEAQNYKRAVLIFDMD